jgi:hypothetical protein
VAAVAQNVGGTRYCCPKPLPIARHSGGVVRLFDESNDRRKEEKKLRARRDSSSDVNRGVADTKNPSRITT